jgi:hypothetical protein
VQKIKTHREKDSVVRSPEKPFGKLKKRPLFQIDTTGFADRDQAATAATN